MTFKRAVCASTIAAGIGIAGVFGIGTASADPGWGCDRPGGFSCGNPDNRGPGDWHNRGPDAVDWRNRGPDPVDWHNRGIDQGRWDHQPFNWNGQEVMPVPAGDGNGWGFWFLGMWIPL